MKAFEASKAGPKGKEFAISISSTIDGAHNVESEFRLIKEALVNWEDAHGQACRDVMLVYTSHESKHADILKYAQFACSRDTRMAPLLARCQVRLLLLNLEGQQCKEFAFGVRPGQPRSAQGPQPGR